MRSALQILLGAGATLIVATCAEADVAAGKTVILRGQVGYIGEWAFSSRLDQTGAASSEEISYAGPLTMRHAGLCSVDGPEEHSGKLTASLRPAGVDKLTLSYERVSCVYSGSPDLKRVAVRGFMRCNGGSQVPIYFWIETPQTAK